MIAFLSHFTDGSCSSFFLFPSNLFQRLAATGPNVSHLTRLTANLACQYVSSHIHQRSFFISPVLLFSHFTTAGLDFARSLRCSIPPAGRVLQGLKAATMTAFAKPKCKEGANRAGVEWRGSV